MRNRALGMSIVATAAAAVIAGGIAAGAGRTAAQPTATIPFGISRMIIEYNSSGNDVGMQLLVDGEPWKSLKVFNPTGREILDITPARGLRRQGMTELFFESSEPSLADVPLDQFLARFPAGEYRFEGVTVDEEEMEGVATFTHAIPEAPVIRRPRPGALIRTDNVEIAWNAVPNPAGSTIVGYQVIVVADNGAFPKQEFSVHVPASRTRVDVPEQFVLPNTVYKFEVLAIEANGNQTITESDFRTR